MFFLLLACTPQRSRSCPQEADCTPLTTEDTQDSSVPQDTDPPPWTWRDGDVAALLGKDRAYSSIQGAITESTDGDVVLVRAGVHTERIDFHGKGIHVVSESGPWETVLDATGMGGSVVEIRAMEPSTAILEGFTLIGGTGTEGHGGGIFVENADPIIQHNIVIGNSANISGGVYLRHGEATVRNNIIVGNRGIQGGGGVVCTNCRGKVLYNTFVDNESPNGALGEWFFESEGDLVGNIVVTSEGDDFLIRFLQPNGYTFDCADNLVWPSTEWVADNAPEGFPDCSNTVYGDPLFVDTERYELAPGSPAIDSGPSTDTDPDGSPADRGAYGGPYGDWSSPFSVDG